MHLLSRAAASETAGIVSPGCSVQLSVTAGTYVPACPRADAPGPPRPACLAAALLAPAVAAASAAFLRLPALLYFSSPDGREQAVEVHGPFFVLQLLPLLLQQLSGSCSLVAAVMQQLLPLRDKCLACLTQIPSGSTSASSSQHERSILQSVCLARQEHPLLIT